MEKFRDFLLYLINIVYEFWGIYIYENVLYEYFGKEYIVQIFECIYDIENLCFLNLFGILK